MGLRELRAAPSRAAAGAAAGGSSAGVRVHVHYPLDGARLVLRAAPDWERDREPLTCGNAGAEFDLPLSAAFRDYKLLLRRGGEERWSQGENLLAFAHGPAVQNVFPFFYADTGCSACEPHEVDARSGGRRHTVRAFLPPGYHENPLAAYPVVYMHDGPNLFFPSEAFGGHAWKIDETLRILTRMNLIQPAIVVGVYPQDRLRDYTSPGYAEYGRFLVETLKPWVDARYRTRTAPRDTALLGSSLGGVVSLHLAWEYPHVFGAAGCLSSTFGYQDDLYERIGRDAKRPLRLYLDSGWPQDNYEATRAMRQLLVARGYAPGAELLYLAFPHARHDEESWGLRAHVPFQHFFAR